MNPLVKRIRELEARLVEVEAERDLLREQLVNEAAYGTEERQRAWRAEQKLAAVQTLIDTYYGGTLSHKVRAVLRGEGDREDWATRTNRQSSSALNEMLAKAAQQMRPFCCGQVEPGHDHKEGDRPAVREGLTSIDDLAEHLGYGELPLREGDRPAETGCTYQRVAFSCTCGHPGLGCYCTVSTWCGKCRKPQDHPIHSGEGGRPAGYQPKACGHPYPCILDGCSGRARGEGDRPAEPGTDPA